VKTGTPGNYKLLKRLDFGLRRNDRKGHFQYLCGAIKSSLFWGFLSQGFSQKWKENTLFF